MQMKPKILLIYLFFITILLLDLIVEAAAFGRSAAETIAFVRHGNVWIAQLNGEKERQISNLENCGRPSISGDGSKISFYCRSGVVAEQTQQKDLAYEPGFGQIYLVNITKGKPQQLSFDGLLAAESPSFSSDGQQLVFVGLSEVRTDQKENYSQIFATMSINIADLSTGKTRKIIEHRNAMLDTGYIYSHPSFSPDGKSILWQHSGSDVSGGFTIMNLDGKISFQFPIDTEDPSPYWGPSLTRDGQKVLCFSPAVSDNLEDRIYFVDRKTGEATIITTGVNPAFVKNGTAIIFERRENRWTENASSNLWILELTPGASPRKIIVNASEPTGMMFLE